MTAAEHTAAMKECLEHVATIIKQFHLWTHPEMQDCLTKIETVLAEPVTKK